MVRSFHPVLLLLCFIQANLSSAPTGKIYSVSGCVIELQNIPDCLVVKALERTTN
jgi:hypothetical protein